jgi:hypothetical protein
VPASRSRPAVLLTLGRLPKALDLARAFAAHGWRVIVAEPYRWHLCRMSRSVERCYAVPAPATDAGAYRAALAGIVSREQVRLVVPVSEEVLHVAPLAADGVPVYGMPVELLLKLHSKREFAGFACSLGLSAPETHPAGSAGAEVLLAGTDCVLKPVRSCSGRGMTYLAAGTPIPELPQPPEPMVMQRRVHGVLLSSFSIAREGNVITTVVYRGTLMAGTVAVAFERVDGHEAIAGWVRAFVARTGYTGFVSFDFIVDADGVPWAIECNPRVTSGIHFLRDEDLAPVILDLPGAAPPRLRAARRLQQFFPALTETQGSFGKPGFHANLGILRSSRDVTWAVNDPLPLVTMPLTSLSILVRAAREGRSLGEVATSDLAFAEPPASASP